MRIGIDARWIFPRISGIGRVTEKLIHHLGEIDRENNYLLLFFQPELKEKYEERWKKYPNLEPVLVPWSLFSPLGQLGMPRLLRRLRIDVFHSTNYLVPFLLTDIPLVATIHDLIPLKFPHFTPRAKKTRFNFLFRWILLRCSRKADTVVAVSHRTGEDLIECLELKKEKIAVVYNGVDEKYCPLEPETVRARLREKWDLSSPFALFVGRFDPYKNVPGLIRDFKIFLPKAADDAKLVIAGHYDPRYPESFRLVRELGLSSSVVFLDNLDEDDLIYLYNGSRVLVQPSYYEGFGLPPLEAMACGTPVVSSNRGALPEVVEDAALIVDPAEEGSIARALERIWSDEGLRARLRERGLKQAQNFSWRKTAEETLAVYKNLALATLGQS